MDTVAMDTRFLELEMIALAKTAGELKRTIWACRNKLWKQQKKENIGQKFDELEFMQEELWQYIQNLEEIQRMYEETNEDLTAIVTS